MIKVIRQKKIIEILRRDSVLSVRELAAVFEVVESTIRRDLEEMEARGDLRRIYGGAIIVNQEGEETPFDQRLVTDKEKKVAIAMAASTLIHDGDTIYIDGGTTTEQMTPYLEKKLRLTVITCGLNIANDLIRLSHVHTIVTGGFIDPFSMTLIPLFEEHETLLDKINISKVFFSCAGVTADTGITNRISGRVPAKKKLLEIASQFVLLADSSKVGSDATIAFAPIDIIDLMITDDDASEHELEKIRARGVNVVVASRDRA